MNMWLYQLNQEDWPPALFRREIWEKRLWHFRRGQKRGDATPEPGDLIVFYYTKASGSDPGIYGWAVFERCQPSDDKADNDRLYFTPSAPTDHLKMDPWWDKEAEEIVKKIQQRMRMASASLLQVGQLGHGETKAVRAGIKRWLNSGK